MGREVSRVATRCVLMLVVAGLVLGVVWLLVAETVLALARHVSSSGTDELSGLPFEEALTALSCLALLGCAAWLVVATCLVAIEGIAGAAGRTAPARVSARLCPAALRRLVLAGCGAALTAGLSGAPALAEPADPADRTAATPASTLVGLPVPDRPVGNVAKEVTTARVRAGDCLWSLAEQTLPQDADDAEITAAWRTIHRANLARIGPDPGLVLPGTVLQIPDLEPSRRKESS